MDSVPVKTSRRRFIIELTHPQLIDACNHLAQASDIVNGMVLDREDLIDLNDKAKNRLLQNTACQTDNAIRAIVYRFGEYKEERY